MVGNSQGPLSLVTSRSHSLSVSNYDTALRGSTRHGSGVKTKSETARFMLGERFAFKDKEKRLGKY